MEKILNGVDNLVSMLTEKGYTQTFTTQAAYRGSMKESILKYMENVILGNEKGLKNGIIVDTDLKNDGPDEGKLCLRMDIRLRNYAFQVVTIQLLAFNKTQQWFKCLCLDLEGKPMPTKSKAIEMIEAYKNIKSKSRRIKF